MNWRRGVFAPGPGPVQASCTWRREFPAGWSALFPNVVDVLGAGE